LAIYSIEWDLPDPEGGEMSRKMFKVLVLGAMVVSALVSASSASAWTSNGPLSFTATAPASRLALTGVSAGINCTTTTSTGRLLGPSGTGKVADLSLAFSTCRAGGFTANVSCPASSVNLTPTLISGSRVTGDVVDNTSTICTITVPSISGCTVTVTPANGIGSVVVRSGSYDDVTGILNVPTGTQALTAAWTSCGTLFGSASGSTAATFADSTGAALNYRVTSSPIPNIR
jgi:hypothetical protein